MQTLDIRSVLGRALAMYRDHWRPLIGMALAVWLATTVATALVALAVAAATATFVVASGVEADVPLAAGIGAVVAIAVFAVQFVGQTILGGMYVLAVEDLRDGRQDRRASEYLAAARPKLGALVATAGLAGAGMIVGFMLLIVPGVVLAVFWSLSSVVVVLEGLRTRAALRRSWELVSGNGWRMLVLLVVPVVAIAAAEGTISALAGAVVDAESGSGRLLASFLAVVAVPFAAIVPVIAYYDLTGRWSATAP